MLRCTIVAQRYPERGNPRADVVVLASWGEGLDLASRGFVDPYESPERAMLREGWTSGGLAAQGGAALAVIVNTDEVPESERPTSWFDLLDPEWQDALTMPDPSLSGSAAEFLAIFVQNFGDEAWSLFEGLARNGLIVPGPNNAALNPVLTGERRATIAGVDYITYGNIARGEALAIIYPEEGTAVALRPVFVQEAAPNAEGGRAFVDFMLCEAGQALVADVYLMPSREGVEARRPVPGDFVAVPADDAEVAATVGAIVERFRDEIVEGIVQQR
ncbi:MAG: extracellular solute-binding protein [Trueperaceae bacterium]|nr:extracellular solute-binding protein [Trueperaceae bacterium]